MIKQSSIDEVRDKADLEELVSRHTPVKQHKACCPFHDEKSPSFSIKNNELYKCFGCGKSGGVIQFVMEIEKLPFTDAIEWLAAHYNLTLEYDQQKQAEAQEVKDKRTEMLAVIKWAHNKYLHSLHQLPVEASAIQYLQKRGYTEERIKAWDIGFAPDGWDFLKTSLINMGKFNVSVECGLIYSKEGKNFDFFRNRIIFPIHDHNGVIVGFGARLIPSGNDDADKKQPKYLNSSESLIYNKKKIWYGLWQAGKSIKEAGFVYVVEGYMDVQSMQDAGMTNTVASSGTEIDELQAKFLKRYTDHVVICYDADKPGIDKALKQIDLFLKLDFKVQIVELPDKKDPDEYIQQLLFDISLTEAEAAVEAGAFAE